jgi:hypothetical protein
MNYSYETASVVVLPTHNGGEAERLQNLEAPTDIIVLSRDQQKIDAMSWYVTCGEGGSDFFQVMAGWNVRDRLELGNLTFSIAKEYVEHRIHTGDRAYALKGTLYYALGLEDTSKTSASFLDCWAYRVLSASYQIGRKSTSPKAIPTRGTAGWCSNSSPEWSRIGETQPSATNVREFRASDLKNSAVFPTSAFPASSGTLSLELHIAPLA